MRMTDEDRDAYSQLCVHYNQYVSTRHQLCPLCDRAMPYNPRRDVEVIQAYGGNFDGKPAPQITGGNLDTFLNDQMSPPKPPQSLQALPVFAGTPAEAAPGRPFPLALATPAAGRDAVGHTIL